MTDEDLIALLDKRDKEKKAAEEAEAARAAKEQARVDAAEKAAEAKAQTEIAALKAQLAAGRRLPIGGQAPAVMHFADTNKYDALSIDDLGFMAAVLKAQKDRQAIRTAEDKTIFKHKNGDEIPLGDMGRIALKAAGIDPADVVNAQKANELDYSTQSGFGLDWVTISYSDRLWELIRFNTWVLDRIPSIEVPQGAATDVIMVQGADPTWYVVAEAKDNNATTGIPDATVTASKVATTSKTLSVKKLGSRVLFSGELIEDSLIPWAANLRSQLMLSGAEQLENAVINGDTETANSTNINAIDTTPGGTEVFMLMNGFRKLPLITNTGNSVNTGALTDSSFLDVVKTMGAAGKNAADKSKVTLILDQNVYWKALTISNLKSIQSFQNSTIENGELTKIWNYEVKSSGFFHANSAKLMANSAGKVDADTDSNNTLGAFLAVRWDQWLFGYKRRMTVETQRFPRSDSTEITALVRVGLVNRDAEASAIGYNVTI